MLWLVTTTKLPESELRPLFKPALSKFRNYRFVKHPREVEPEPGDVVLLFGQAATTPLREEGLLHKSSTINTLRQKKYTINGVHWMVTFEPFEIMTVANRATLIQIDLQMAVRLHGTGTLEPDYPHEYRYVEDFDDVVAYCKQQIEKGGRPVLAYDLETLGLDPLAPEGRIISITYSYEEGQADCLLLKNGTVTPYVEAQLHYLCHTPAIKTIGANIKYDMVWTETHLGIQITNVALDIGVVGSLLDENRQNNLNLLAKIYTNMGGYDDGFNKRFDKGRMDIVAEEHPDEFLYYAGGDTDATLKAYSPLKASLLRDERQVMHYHSLMHKSIPAFAQVERRGVLVDIDYYNHLRGEVQEEIVRLEKEMIDLMPTRVKLAHRDNLKLTRANLITDLFFSPMGFNLKPQMKTPKGAVSTSIDHLKLFREHDEAGPFVSKLEEYNSAKKTMSTYIVGFLKHLRSDGRFHPTYNLYHSATGGTVTGRLSAFDPAYQTIPKHTKWAKPLRRAIVAPEGHGILKLDYSQGELRVTACVAEEPTMIEVYRQGIDLHSTTAAEVNHKTLEEFMALPDEIRGELRFGAKAVNFGLIYGMQPPGFVAHAQSQFGLTYTVGEAQDIRDAFFGLYPRLLEWHEEAKEFAHRHGFIRSPLGRVRHLPLINSPVQEIRSKQERQAINSPIQSCLSDMMVLAMAELHEQYPDLWCFGMTHDEAQFYVPVDELHLWHKRIKEVMENLPFEKFGWHPPIPFPADAEWSETNLAECNEIALSD